MKDHKLKSITYLVLLVILWQGNIESSSKRFRVISTSGELHVQVCEDRQEPYWSYQVTPKEEVEALKETIQGIRRTLSKYVESN